MIKMTVSSQVKQTIATLKGVRSTMETFASIEENREAKEAFVRNAQQIGRVIGEMEKRLGVMEFEEPQYKGF